MSERILMIEDDRALAAMVAEYLGKSGMEVTTREDAAGGLAALARADFDAVILDVMLPDRDGFEVCRSILSGPTIDRAAIEKLRAEEMALADTLSRTVAAALADSAEVLTPEQRTELLERLGRFHHRH